MRFKFFWNGVPHLKQRHNINIVFRQNSSSSFFFLPPFPPQEKENGGVRQKKGGTTSTGELWLTMTLLDGMTTDYDSNG